MDSRRYQRRQGGMKTILSILIAVLIAIPCLALETIYFDLPDNSPESVWRDALAKLWDGQTEVVIPHGRIDVETDDYVVEIDFSSKWCEGLGQALFYAHSTGKQGIVALIIKSPEAIKDKLNVIEILLNKYDIGLLVLTYK